MDILDPTSNGIWTLRANPELRKDYMAYPEFTFFP